jgi:SAM-dependent methyltransferase
LIQTPSGESCPACGSRQFQKLFQSSDRLYGTTDRAFDVVECSGCRLIRLFPWPDPDELKRYYPENYWFSPDEDTASRLEERYRRLVLRDHVAFVSSALQEAGPPGPLLDVGCGGGLFPRILREAGCNAVGLDFSRQAAQVAWHQNGVPVAAGLLSCAPFRPGQFSVVTMFHVLEHLYDPGSYVEAARDLLRSGGKLIVQVPNAASWQFLLFGENWNGMDVPRHLIDFRGTDVDALLENYGFEVVRHKYFSLRDNPAGMATSIAPSLDPVARRVRRKAESPAARLARDLIYLGLVLASLPFTILEAACRAGSTVMVEARKR